MFVAQCLLLSDHMRVLFVKENRMGVWVGPPYPL